VYTIDEEKRLCKKWESIQGNIGKDIYTRTQDFTITIFYKNAPPIKYLISEIIYANLVVIVLCQYDAVNILQILFTFHPLHKLKWAFQFIPSKSQFEQQTHWTLLS